MVATVLAMLMTPRLELFRCESGRADPSQTQLQMRCPHTGGSQSRCGSNAATEEFFVSANHIQRFCVAHLDADGTGDLPADVAQQRSFGCCRDRSRPALGIQEVLRNLLLCRFAAPRARLGDNYRL